MACSPEYDTSSLIDRLEQALAHAALFGADIEGAPKLGRFIVLRRLGAGGMSVIYEAFDPKLDRKVAVKVMRAALGDSSAGTQTRLLREAQALAKLGHTNVVAVFDVGTVAEHVWLAMELVDGLTLAAWAAQGRPSWSEALAVITQAGRGLEAAHAAGLVHRDFKPDNVMIGLDGRVRVVDFGLAHGTHANERAMVADTPRPDVEALAIDLTVTGSIRGTPAYMAPEQWRGDDVGPAADQFAWSITAWELLFGERPFLDHKQGETRSWRRRVRHMDPGIPAWLRRIIERGLGCEPSRRWPTMAALLAAMERGRQRARMRTGASVIAGLSVVVAGFSGYYHWDQTRMAEERRQEYIQRVVACEDAGARIDEVWNDATRAGVREGIVATGVSYAPVTAEKVMPFLDAQAEAWREHRTRACLAATVEETLSEEHLDRAEWCLNERRMELSALATELSRADAIVVQKAVIAAAGLPPVSPCNDGQILAALPPPPPTEARARTNEVRATLSRARTLLLAGKFPDGLKQTRAALADAKAIDWPPLTAAAWELEGYLLEATGAYVDAEAASLAAYMAAAKVRAWDVAARAALHLEFNIGYKQARHAEGKVWADHTEVAFLFAGDPLDLGEANRLSNLALIHNDTGEYAEAKALAGRALAIRERTLGPEHPYVAVSLNNLALVHQKTGGYAEAKVLIERALAINEKALGTEHPDVANSIRNLAHVYYYTGAYVEAMVLYERALAIKKRALGPEHPDVASSLNDLANVYYATGVYAEAVALHERALAIREKALGHEHPRVAESLNNLANVHQQAGSYADAKALHERALAIKEKALGSEHPDVANSLRNLALVHEATGAYAEAKVLYERALAIKEKALGPEHPDVANSLGLLGNLALIQHQSTAALPLLERAVTIYDAHEGMQWAEPETRFSLARVLLITKGDRTRALSEARKAADPYRAAGVGKAKELAEVEAFLIEHGGAL